MVWVLDMDNFISWLILSGWGILFGLFPGYISAAGMLYEAMLVQKKKPAKLLSEAFFIDSEHPEVALWARGPRRTRKMTWYISFAYVAIFLIGAHYLSWIDVNREVNVLSIIIEETSLPFFLLLTWLLPVYFMKRYLKKLKPRGEIDRFTYYDHD